MQPIPEGFELVSDDVEDVSAVPDGFELVQPEPSTQDVAAPEEDSLPEDVFNVVSEFAASANRSVTEFIDFIGPDTVNAISGMVGSDFRVPTLTEALEPTGIQGGFMQPGTARDIVQGAGSVLPAAAAMVPVAGRNLATNVADQAAEFLGAGSAAATAPIKASLPAVTDAASNVLPSSRSARKAAELPLKRQSGDVAAAGFKLNDAGKAIPDPIQNKAIKAGLDEGAVAMISASNKATRSRMTDMIEVLEGGKKNLEFRNFNPPQRVVGQAITDRLGIVQQANKEAGKGIDKAANAIKGQSVDVAPAINKFLDDLASEGIGVNVKAGVLDFSDSTIEGLKEPQNIINNVFQRLRNTKDPTIDAHRVHIAKKFIDEQVSFGKTQAGLSGRMEGIVKGLRHNLDAILDSQFPEYDRVNTVYKETRDVIDEIQSLAGRKVNLTGDKVDKAMGTMSRKVLSNYNTGTAMESLFESLDDVARRYSTPLNSSVDDDLKKLVTMEAEIRRLFPSAIKPNTFQGQIGAEAARAAGDLATGNKAGPVVRGLKKVQEKIFSKSDQDKIDAIKDLLKNQRKIYFQAAPIKFKVASNNWITNQPIKIAPTTSQNPIKVFIPA